MLESLYTQVHFLQSLEQKLPSPHWELKGDQASVEIVALCH